MIEVIQPSNEQAWLELRTKDITSTEVSALFGISPYMTYFELWHRKRCQQFLIIDPNERMKWGTRLQDAIAGGVAEENGWNVRRMTEYIRNSELRIGASFDFQIIGMLDSPFPIPELLEIKNVDGLVFKNEWYQDDDGALEAPLHIELQVQHQLLVSRLKRTHLAALIAGNRLEMFERIPDQKVHDAIIKRCAAFWHSVDNNIEPDVNFDTDAEFLKTLYSFAQPGTILDLSNNQTVNDLALRYKGLTKIATDAQKEKDSLKAQMLTMIGPAEKVLLPNFKITAGMVGPAHLAFDRAGYRDFRVYDKKEKKK